MTVSTNVFLFSEMATIKLVDIYMEVKRLGRNLKPFHFIVQLQSLRTEAASQGQTHFKSLVLFAVHTLEVL